MCNVETQIHRWWESSDVIEYVVLEDGLCVSFVSFAALSAHNPLLPPLASESGRLVTVSGGGGSLNSLSFCLSLIFWLGEGSTGVLVPILCTLEQFRKGSTFTPLIVCGCWCHILPPGSVFVWLCVCFLLLCPVVLEGKAQSWNTSV